MNPSKLIGTAIIFVAIPVEYEEVVDRLRDLDEFKADGQTFEYGYLDGEDGDAWKVIVVETGDGNNKTAANVAKWIAEFEPDVTLFCGIAGGVKDLKLGDVVVGTTIYFYDRVKEEEILRTRPTETAQASEPLLQTARHVARRAARDGTSSYKIYLKPIATGAAVVAHPRGKIVELITNNYNDAIAVETEGSGYMMSAHIFQTPALVIRAASDLLADKTATDRAGWQSRAAANAADFTLKVLARASPPAQTNASNLISWQQVTEIAQPLCRQIEVQFSPDVVVSMSGPGSWAPLYTMSLRERNAATLCAVTFPISNAGSESFKLFEAGASGDSWIHFRTSRWIVYIPDIFQELDRGGKILLFDDRVITGESQFRLKQILVNRGFRNVRTAALYASKADNAEMFTPDFIGLRLDGEFIMPWGRRHGRL